MIDQGGEKTGLKTAVAEAVARRGAADDMDAEQLTLLPMPLRNAAEGEGAEKRVPATRGRGRPPGAKNKSTQAWTEFLLNQYRSPLQVLAEIYSRSPADIAKELGHMARIDIEAERKLTTRELELVEIIRRHEETNFDRLMRILQMQIGCAKDLAPYVHQKQPMAIEAGEGGLIPLNIILGNVVQPDDQAAKPAFKILDVNNEEYQSLSNQEKTESAAHESAARPDNGENKGKVNNQSGDETSPRKEPK